MHRNTTSTSTSEEGRNMDTVPAYLACPASQFSVHIGHLSFLTENHVSSKSAGIFLLHTPSPSFPIFSVLLYAHIKDCLTMPDSLKVAQQFIFVTQVHFCAMYAVAIWDWVVCLPREWRFIWKTPWTTVKVSYIFCRYWVIAVIPYLLWAFCTDHDLEECEKIFQIPVGLAMWNQVSAEVILLIRTYAFFGRNVYMLALLIAALSGVVAYQLYVVVSRITLFPFLGSSFGPCLPMSKPHSGAHLLGFFIAPLMYDTIVTAATVGKAVTIRRQSGGHSGKLLQTFLREGIFYYILISMTNLVNGIFYLQPRQAISAICIPLSVMLSPVLACRLILDLRARACESVCYSTSSVLFAAVARSKSNLGPPLSQLRFGRFERSTSNDPVRSQSVAIGPFSMDGIDLSASELEMVSVDASKEHGMEC
ncbi:hypothetical protein C8Q75DRAFT_778697 [Abortiporus biennis]|nr:hypothetical protein C8Q75DRAFT_778697 [Abortiporus biennis]